jgi:RimJ/RimL family protein N-acetyltransferase
MPRTFHIRKLSPEEWTLISENAHRAMFKENRAASLDRISFAIIVEDEGGLCGYLTARELDAENVYWQFGGAFPGTHSSHKAFEYYGALIEKMKELGYKRITTLVENDNVRYLKLAMHFGFRIIGVRIFKGTVLVELLNDFEESHASREDQA